MIDLSKIDNIYLVPGATDMRKSADGCAAIVQYQLYCNPPFQQTFLFSATKPKTS